MILCIDIGGTNIKSAIIGDDLVLRNHNSVETQNNLNYILEYIHQLMTKFPKIEGISLSVPGQVNSKTGVVNGISAVSCINGFSWKETLMNKYNVDVAIQNDGNCVVLADVVYGNAQEYQNIVSIVIGTGVGGGAMFNGILIEGHDNRAGEIGFTIINNETMCTLNDGCSLGSLVKRVNSKLGYELSGKEIFCKAEQGDLICKSEVESFYRNIAIGVYNVGMLLNPECIVLSGAVSEQKDFITNINVALSSVLKTLSMNTFGIEIDMSSYIPNIITSRFGKDSNLIGAYAQFSSDYFSDRIKN